MTHYLLLACMPEPLMTATLDDIRRFEFNWNLNYAKKERLCICHPTSQATVREFKLLEVDIPTPATADFERFIGEHGFAPIEPKAEPDFLDKKNIMQESACKGRLTFFNRIFSKLFFKTLFWLIDKFLRLEVAPQGLKSYGSEAVYGTIYRPFSSMRKDFDRIATRPYKYQPQFNSRNKAIGRMIETPIGSFYDCLKATECPKCKKIISQH